MKNSKSIENNKNIKSICNSCRQIKASKELALRLGITQLTFGWTDLENYYKING